MLFSQIRQCLLIGLSRCLARALSSIFEANLRSSVRFAEGKEEVGAFVHSLGVLDSHLSHTITVYRSAMQIFRGWHVEIHVIRQLFQAL